MKKILMIIPALNAGGSERVMVTLANEWSLYRDVTILTYANAESFYKLNENVKLERMGIMPIAGGIRRKISIPVVELRRLKYIYKKVKENDYEFILSFTNTANIFSSIISILMKDENVVISERAAPLDYSKFMQVMIKLLYRKNKLIICQNKYVCEYFKKLKIKSQLVVLPNPVNYDDIPTCENGAKRKEIVTVGRLTEQKNHKLLIESFKDVLNKYPDYVLRIYGEGPLKESLQVLINEMKLSDHVILEGTRKKVMNFVKDAEIFVLTSNFEGFPNVLIEAMATGLPVISSNFSTGVAEDLIKDGINGFLFTVNDRQSLSQAMIKMLFKKNEFKIMGDMNRKIALKYKDNKVSDDWISTIENKLELNGDGK